MNDASPTNDFRIFVVDDDPLVLRSLERLLRANGFDVNGYTCPSAFLDQLPHDGPGCVLLDLLMPGLSGLDVQMAMAARDVALPVVFLSGHGDVATTARAMRSGAVDFLVKPINEADLLDAIARAGARALALRQQRRTARDADTRFARLTRREQQVSELVACGLPNKQIASRLGIVEKTIKVHRGRAMHKLEVSSVAALVRLLGNRS